MYAFIADFFIVGGSIPFLPESVVNSHLLYPKQPFERTYQGAAYGTYRPFCHERTIENSLLVSTLKIKRKVIKERFSKQTTELYRGQLMAE
jgi:hypothetical protein